MAGSTEGEPPELRRVGREAPVNAGARSPGDISAHNSPTLVTNPRRRGNLAVASRVDTPFFACSLHVSFDGGKRWSDTAIPAPRGEEAKCFAPDVTFTGDGTLHLSFVTLKGKGNVPHAVWVASSSDGGRTLSTPKRVHGPLTFQVRVVADPANRRRLYMTWLQGLEVAPLKFPLTGNPIQVVRSDDGGKTWTKPRQVSPGGRERVITPVPAVGPRGELYVLYVDVGNDMLDYNGGHNGRGGPPFPGRYQLVLARSLDRGKTWAESVVDRELRPIHRFVVFFPPSPSLAVAADGRIYAAFHDQRPAGGADVMLWTLATGERSRWQGPRRVNDTPAGERSWQYLPKLSLAPDGRLDVLYYDRRSDPKRNVMNQVSLQSSSDHGKTFSRAIPLASRAFDSRIGFGAKEGLPDLGSRLGLVSVERYALGLWTDTRSGTPATQKQDLAAVAVAVTKTGRPSAASEDALRYGGIVLIVGGLGLALMAAARRRAVPRV